MNYYGYQQPTYGGFPHMGQPMIPTMGAPMMPPTGNMYQQGQAYGPPMQGGYGGIGSYCNKCGGTGYRIKKNGMTKQCKCIKKQEKKMGKYYGYSSSDSD